MKINLPTRSFIRTLLTLIFCLSALLTNAAGPSEQEIAALKSYYNASASHTGSPDVLKMCDTLAMRAKQVGSNYYVLLAATLRLDYYYFRNDKDKVPEYAQEAKRLSREYNEPKQYYFVWGSRLITFYLKNGMSNHALFEAQSMLREAQSEESQKGMIECYKAIGNVYKVQSNHTLAAEYFRKAIDLVEVYDPTDVNIPVYYASLFDCKIRSEHLKEAEDALDKIETYLSKRDSITPYQQLSISQSRLKLSVKKRDSIGIREAYDRIEELYARNKALSIHGFALQEARLTYFTNSKQYNKALSIIDSILRGQPTADVKTYLLGKKGEILWSENNRASAAECYKSYISLTDSTRQLSAQNSANEIAGLLNVQQLEREKQLLQVDLQNRRLRTTYWAIAILGLALIIGTIVVIWLTRLNLQLREAKQLVLLQNEALQEAKEQAEQASTMKSQFIQDISHEVRTPLNAIVGFSQVVGDLCDQPETKEYAAIIATSSDHLLRLFNDILELSSLDQLRQLSYNATEDINTSCKKAIDNINSLVKEGVKMTFRPSESQLQIQTNPTYVVRILDSLLHNAAKFTESGHIELSYTLFRTQGIICYSVADTGPGIPAETQAAIFERFKKGNSFAQGPGLGLAVCSTIASKLGGALTLDKDYTPGCRFLLTLPLVLPIE